MFDGDKGKIRTTAAMCSMLLQGVGFRVSGLGLGSRKLQYNTTQKNKRATMIVPFL